MEKIDYDKKEWIMVARTNNFVVFDSKRIVTTTKIKKVLGLCEELLKHNYIPDFAEISRNTLFFRKCQD